ncbi:MraY family glycosyltransferase [Parvibium lacunae]|uniref:Glycosyl transferase n=1 Tax=Parvibium lacunae TaxID=1888893 RepID=A0A368L1Z3_9BURK|nr:glycosyltransferase family 4 protein [Parvibium lacunae]RCS57410.1 hypothetical protein DU000_08075 [Parvibium lacunae]
MAHLFLLAFVVTALLIFLGLKLNLGRWFLDVPNQRSLHSQPTPRFGGSILMMVTLIIAMLYVLPIQSASLIIFLSALCLVILGTLDDRYSLPASTRLIIQLISAMICLTQLPLNALPPGSSLIGTLLLVIITAWSANLFNFMDGLDGLAGSMAAIGFTGYALLLVQLPPTPWAQALLMLCLIIIGSTAGFLLFNRPQATIFMGDAGSITLGFLAAIVGILGYKLNFWSWRTPCLLFWPFIFDSSYTLIKRIARGEKIWQAHRQHVFQRMILAGLDKRLVLGLHLIYMLLCLGLALYLESQVILSDFLIMGILVIVSITLCNSLLKKLNAASKNYVA